MRITSISGEFGCGRSAIEMTHNENLEEAGITFENLTEYHIPKN